MKTKTLHPNPLSTRSEGTKNVSTVRSPFSPVLVWLLLQLIALAISAGRIPFYAIKSFPQPAELIALPLMLVVQIGASALLFPFLLRDFRTAGLVVVASWPFTVLAGFLTGITTTRGIPYSAIYVTIWLAGLGLWNKALRSPRGQVMGVAIALFGTFGGVLLNYLSREYGREESSSILGTWGPIQQAIQLSRADEVQRIVWIIAGIYLVLSLAAWGFGRFKKTVA